MARKNQSAKLAQMSAIIVALAQTVRELCEAIEVLPEPIANRLNALQEMAYQTVDVESQVEFGVTFCAAMGVPYPSSSEVSVPQAFDVDAAATDGSVRP